MHTNMAGVFDQRSVDEHYFIDQNLSYFLLIQYNIFDANRIIYYNIMNNKLASIIIN